MRPASINYDRKTYGIEVLPAYDDISDMNAREAAVLSVCEWADLFNEAAAGVPAAGDSFTYWVDSASVYKTVSWSTISGLLATAFKHGGSNELATASPAANVIPKTGAASVLDPGFLPAATTATQGAVKFNTTGVEDATKTIRALGNEILALLTACGISLTPATGASSLDGIADSATWKKVAAAVATALNAGTYDAAKCTAFGVGGDCAAAVDDWDNYGTSGKFSGSGLAHAPLSGTFTVDVTSYGPGYARQKASTVVGSVRRDFVRWSDGGTWTPWFEVFNAFSDGNGGQPPQPKYQGTNGVLPGFIHNIYTTTTDTLEAGGTFFVDVVAYVEATGVLNIGNGKTLAIMAGGTTLTAPGGNRLVGTAIRLTA